MEHILFECGWVEEGYLTWKRKVDIIFGYGENVIMSMHLDGKGIEGNKRESE